MSKKIYLSLLIACIGFIAQAQVKMYEYPSGYLTEKIIAEYLEKAKENNASEENIIGLDKMMHRRMQEQQDILSGKTQVQRTIPPSVNTSGCVNPGFENGTKSNWNLFSGSNSGISLPCNSCPTTPGGINTIVTSTTTVTGQCTNGIDNYGNFPVISPAPNPGGSYALLLNDNTAGYKMQKATYSFVVSTSNDIFTFQYAAVLQSPGTAHTSISTKPYFHVDVTDNTTNAAITCTEYEQDVPSSGSLAGWSVSTLDPNVYYKPWVTVSVDLSGVTGHTVTLSYVVSDCNQGGHFGYAYVDGDCGDISVTNVAGICSGNNANLCGPSGYSTYSWTGPTTGTSQCLNTGTAGTYTLHMTSALTCPPPVLTYTVSASPAPTPSISIATTPCSLNISSTDLSTVSSGTISNWEWNWGDGQTSPSTTAGSTQAHTYSAQGTYNVVMTCTTSAGCIGTYSVPVNLNGTLSAPVTSSSVTCNGASTGSATVAPTGGSGTYNYSWTPSGQTTSVAVNLAAGTYVCAVNDGAGCSGSTTVTIAEATGISSTSSTVQSTCNNFNGSASVSVSGGTGPYTYTWTSGGGNTSSITGVGPGTYTCNVTDANTCTYSTSVNVTNQPLPAITSISTTSVTCYNGTNGSANVVATGSGLSYNWAPSGGSAATANGLSYGVYTVTVTDVNSCTVTAVDSVLQATAIAATSSVNGSICGGSSGSATVTPSGGTNTYSYSWSPSGGSSNIATSLSAGNYNCTITDGNSCVKTVSVFITTTSGPTVTVAATSSVSCNGLSNGSASVTSVSGGSGALTYTWLPGPVSNTNTVSNIPAATYTCVVQDAVGCFGSNTVTINQPAALSTPVVTTSVSCNGGSNGSATINTSGGTGPYSYAWSPSGGNSATASGLAFGTYSCAILDAHNCPAATTASITQPSALSATASSTSVSCNGGNNGTAAVTPAGGVGPYTYAWSPAGGSNSSAINLTQGNYVTTITDANSCTFTVASTVTQPTAITTTLTSTNIDCSGKHDGSATVTATGGTGAYTYSWSPTGGTSSTTPSTLNPGTYTSTVKDANGCITKTTFTITQPTALAVTSTVTPVKCSGASNGTAHVNISGGVPTYTVTWNTSPVQTGTATTITGVAAGLYTATVTDANGCTKNKTFTIVSPEPKDSLEMTATLCSTDPNVVLLAPNGTDAPYQWYDNGTVITGETSSNYTAIQANVQDYAVTWTHNGCAYITNTVQETILADLSTYPQTNIFTPNDDRINDEFYPFAPLHSSNNVSTLFVTAVSNMVKEYQLYVYDRWGKMIYSSSSYSQPWDGKHAGKDAPDGTYYWIVNYKTNCNNNRGTQKIKGFVQLLR